MKVEQLHSRKCKICMMKCEVMMLTLTLLADPLLLNKPSIAGLYSCSFKVIFKTTIAKGCREQVQKYSKIM